MCEVFFVGGGGGAWLVLVFWQSYNMLKVSQH